MSATEETATVGVALEPLDAAGDEDWRWMVAADPAFYLDEPGTAGTAAGEAG